MSGVCTDCEILRNIKCDYLEKSPPNENLLRGSLLRGYEFKKRWFTLGWNIICKKCALDDEMIGATCLVLSYFTDNQEKVLKGKLYL